MSTANGVKNIYRTNNITKQNKVNNFKMENVDNTPTVLSEVPPGATLTYYITNETYGVPLLMEASFWKAHKANPTYMTINLEKDPLAADRSGILEVANTSQIRQFLEARKSSIDALNPLKENVNKFIQSGQPTNETVSGPSTTNGLFVKLCSLLVQAATYLGAGNAELLQKSVQDLNTTQKEYALKFSESELEIINKKDSENLIQALVRNNERDELKRSYQALKDLGVSVTKFVERNSKNVNNKRAELETLQKEKQEFDTQTQALQQKLRNLESVRNENDRIAAQLSDYQAKKNLLNARLSQNKLNLEAAQLQAKQLTEKLGSSDQEYKQLANNIKALEAKRSNLGDLTQLNQVKRNLESRQWNSKKENSIKSIQKALENRSTLNKKLLNIIPTLEQPVTW